MLIAVVISFLRGAVLMRVWVKRVWVNCMTGIGRKYMFGSWFENYVKVLAKYIHICVLMFITYVV